MKSKIGVIFLVSVLALAGLGISYAGWTDAINVTGSVQTGHVGFDVTGYSGTWVWKVYPHDKVTTTTDVPPYQPGGGELVAHSQCYAVGTDESEVGFEFVNLFPCVDFNADFEFTIGTIPVFLTATDIDWDDQTVNGQIMEWIDGIAEHPAPVVTVTITDPAGVVVYPGTAPIQLHPGITYRWNLRIHIPQDNVYMNAYAAGTCTLNIIQWSDNCEPPLDEKLVNLPTGDVGFGIWLTNYYGGDLYSCTSKVTSISPAGSYNIAVGDYLVTWCADEEPVIYVGYSEYNNPQYYTAHIYSTYSAENPYTDPDWDHVNWIINHRTDPAYSGITGQGVQQAIWYFVNGGAQPTDPLGMQLKNDALANGEDFVPGPGQNLAVVVIVPGYQTIFWEVDP